MRFTLIAAAAMATTVSAQIEQVEGAEQRPIKAPVPGAITSQGCFSAKVGEKADLKPSFVSSGQCADACEEGDFTVAITGGQACYCANEYPPKDALADDKNCDYSCPGYPLEACGGLGDDGYFSAWNLGVKINVPNAEGGDDSNDGEDKPKDDSKADNGEKENGKEDNGETSEVDDEHHSSTAPSTASQTPSGTATVTTSVSATPTADDSDDNNDDAESTSATASPTPVESDPPESAAAGLALNMATVAGALAVVAAAF